MLYGIKLTDKQAMLTDEQSGKQIVETAPPTVSDGYKADWHWKDTGSQLVQTWEIKPIEGTAEDAMLTLAKMQASTLSDDDAAQVPALYDEWINGESYETGDRVRYLGVLYKCLQEHIAQADWTPTAAPSLCCLGNNRGSRSDRRSRTCRPRGQAARTHRTYSRRVGTLSRGRHTLYHTRRNRRNRHHRRGRRPCRSHRTWPRHFLHSLRTTLRNGVRSGRTLLAR